MTAMQRPRNPLADTHTARVERAAKRGADFYCRKVTLADEAAADKAWEMAQTLYRMTPSTSVVPRRCRCGEWNEATRDRCRVCRQSL